MKAPLADADLQAAFRTAHFRIDFPQRSLVRRIGVVDATADSLLAANGCLARWAVVTPCNPSARRLTAAQNALRLDQMRHQLDGLRLRHLPALNSAADGSWPEPGCCILDAETTVLDKLARQYAQLAYVAADLGAAPELVWMPRTR